VDVPLGPTGNQDARTGTSACVGEEKRKSLRWTARIVHECFSEWPGRSRHTGSIGLRRRVLLIKAAVVEVDDLRSGGMVGGHSERSRKLKVDG
jgi:hypothetical protein